MTIKRLLLIGLVPLLFLGCRQLSVEEELEEYEWKMTAAEVCSYVESNLNDIDWGYAQLEFEAFRAIQKVDGQWGVDLKITAPYQQRWQSSCTFDEKTGAIGGTWGKARQHAPQKIR